MDLGTAFKLSLYGLTALVGAILGAAEGEGITSSNVQNPLVLPYLSLPLVVFGFLVTEAWRSPQDHQGHGLSSVWANLLGLFALVATGMEFASENKEGKLLAGTHLLLYVTWIVLFQQKTVRLYWFLMALGILQLAVASVLTSKGWFGFCAIIYMFGAVWTLSIFSLWRAEQIFAEDERKQQAERAFARETSQQSRLAAQFRSRVHSAVHHEGGTRWLSIRFVTGVLMTTCSALLVSAVFFIFIPRVWVGPEFTSSELSEASSAIQRKTGLATSVRLGYLGSALESNERVFEIQLFNLKTQQPISVSAYADLLGMAEPLFRGAVLIHYDSGKWGQDEVPTPPIRSFKSNELSLTDVAVKQEIILSTHASDVLFCLGTPLKVVDRKNQGLGEYDQSAGILNRADDNPNSVSYTAYTRLPSQKQLNFRQTVSPRVRQYYQISRYLERAMRLPRGLYRLEEITRNVIDKATARVNRGVLRENSRRLNPLEVAEALESYLRDSGEFRYTIDISVSDGNVDPIEDFIANRKEGHCEYFATAMALMLRAANIPSRVVSGYKGGVVPSGHESVFEVQQRFSHLWVEAWVDNDGWTTFDPTPEDQRNQSLAAVMAKQKSLWAGMQTTFSGLWSENVLNMSLDRQEASLYRPLRRVLVLIGSFVQELFTSPRSALKSLINGFSDQRELFSFEGGLVAFIAMVLIVAFVALMRSVIHWIRLWIGIRGLFGGAHRSRRFVEFYERFLRLARAKGLKPAAHQTQREFAELVANAYSPELTAFGLLELPTKISQTFYKVRFGDQDLTASEISEVDDLLAKFELALSNGSHRE